MTVIAKACFVEGANQWKIGTVECPDLSPTQVLVGVKAVGICGSDLHYFLEGKNGNFVVREPLIPGHELSAEVLAVGRDVRALRAGQRVAVNPSLSCGRCHYCLEGLENHCSNVFFMGSASKFPHMHGAMRDKMVVEEKQCFVLPDSTPFTTAAFAEPLAVCLHAVEQARTSLMGKNVLVMGAGPIGALTVAAARLAGARAITVVDIQDQTLAAARKMGADVAINSKSDSSAIEELTKERGVFDVTFEATGNFFALNSCIQMTRPCGTIVQVGSMAATGADNTSWNALANKEITYRGTMRFGREYAWAVGYLISGRVDVTPLLSGTFPVENVKEALDMARDRSRAMKVMITF